MTYLSGIAYGTDEISSRTYLEDALLFDEGDYTINPPSSRHYNGMDYHPDGASYKPPLDTTTVPREEYVSLPRKLYDLWRLKIDTKQREGITSTKEKIIAKTPKETFIVEDNMFWMFIGIIIFITFIYSLATYKLVKYAINMQKYEEIVNLLTTLKDLVKTN